jgi:hypothetical protein
MFGVYMLKADQNLTYQAVPFDIGDKGNVCTEHFVQIAYLE